MHQAILRIVHNVKWRTTSHRCVAIYSTCFMGAWPRYNKPKSQSIYWDHVHPSHTALYLWDQICWELQTTMASPALCMMLHEEQRPWMCCHPIHIFCGFMGKVWQAWDIISTLGPCSSKPQSTQAVGPDLARTAKQWCYPQDWLSCYVQNDRPWVCCHPFHIFCGFMGKIITT